MDAYWHGQVRHLHVVTASWFAARELHGAYARVAQKAEVADRGETAQSLYDLQRALERLEQEAKVYQQQLENLRTEIGYFTAEVAKARVGAKQDGWQRPDGLDDELVDRLGEFYGLPKQGPK